MPTLCLKWKATRMGTISRVPGRPGVVVEPGVWCAGDTGKEQRVKVPYDEGVATRIGPEPCAGACEGTGEASVGECIGQLRSRERGVPGADTVTCVEGNTYGRASASVHMPRRGRRTWHV